jgi:hypothetical protein
MTFEVTTTVKVSLVFGVITSWELVYICTNVSEENTAYIFRERVQLRITTPFKFLNVFQHYAMQMWKRLHLKRQAFIISEIDGALGL